MKRITTAAMIVLLAAGPAFAQAQSDNYPNRPIVWVVPFPPGGSTDNGARAMSKALGEKLGQPVIVDNKPGAGGIVGTEYVMNAKPDGYTVLYGSSGPIGTFLALYKNLSYHPVDSFVPVSGMASSPLVLVTTPAKPYKTFAELIDFAKKNPGKLNYASAGSGTAQHLTGALLAMSTGTEMTHIPYKGAGPASIDTLSGVIDIMFDLPVVVKPQIEAGKFIPLAVAASQRLSSLPDVPTTAELGFPDIVFTSWSIVLMPKGTPAPIVEKFKAAFIEAMNDPFVTKYYENLGSQIMPAMTREELTDFITRENAKTRAIIEKANITPD